MNKKRAINLKLAKNRGHSITIIGAICDQWKGKAFQYMLAEKTNVKTVRAYLKQLAPLIPRGRFCNMVLDNHPAHRSHKVKNLAHELGFRLHFLPPMASELNPVERMWAYFKQEWRKRLYNPSKPIPDEETNDVIYSCLD